MQKNIAGPARRLPDHCRHRGGSGRRYSSGVRIEHLQRGDGARPGASSTVLVHYQGTLDNGKVFDSSIARNQPIAFPLNGVIPCWTQGLQRMRVGGKAKLTCPSRTAYGEAGAGSAVPPNATLNFEVQLLKVD